MIDSLGHSATAYEAAKDRLERKFGGRRRQIAIYLEELEQFRQIRTGNAKDIEEFADLLDIAMINLQEAGHHHELGDGSLYNKLQRKIPEAMLARYQRWLFEHNKEESVVSLRTWILQEAEFQTVASEKVRGVTGKLSDTPTRSTPRQSSQRTFFGEAKGGQKSQKSRCPECEKQHGIWVCPEFIHRSVQDRWSTAKTTAAVLPMFSPRPPRKILSTEQNMRPKRVQRHASQTVAQTWTNGTAKTFSR